MSSRLQDLIKAGLLVGLPLALILKQPDLGDSAGIDAHVGSGGISSGAAVETCRGHSA